MFLKCSLRRKDGRTHRSRSIAESRCHGRGKVAQRHVFPGNTTDKKTLSGMLATIRRRFGAAERIWVMDRGIPTQEVLAELRATEYQVRHLVGTPKGRLTRYQAALAEKPWREVRPQLRVKLLPEEGELYMLAESQGRAGKGRGMRRRQRKAYWKRLGELQAQRPARDELLKKQSPSYLSAPT